MSAINDGGQAFPWHERGIHYGMTLRDYFAAKAMQSLLVADGTSYLEVRVRRAYEVADSMLAAREPKS
jgi:vacuolar-type H+-ATPase catalytic subunit A/Vma1